MTTNRINHPGITHRARYLLLIPIFFFFGCEDFLSLDAPNSQLTAQDVFEGRSTANAAVSDLYAQMRETGFLSGNATGLSVLLSVYADDMQAYGTGGLSAFYTNNLLASDATVASLWDASYNQIYAANQILEKLEGSAALSPQDKAQFRGEALFVRALNHFYLAQLFGDAPLALTTNYQNNTNLPRTAQSIVSAQVVIDLEEAQTLLPEESITTATTRANRAVVQAFLARVYLQMGMWPEASNMASAFINRDALFSLTSPVHAFLRGAASTIWEFAPNYEGKNTNEAAVFIFNAGPPSYIALSENLIQAFDPMDLRQSWVQAVTNGTQTWHHAFKYKQMEDTAATLECSVLLRLHEQYLIRAEARAMQGDLIGAGEDLNRIRLNAGLSATTANTSQTLLEDIATQRRLELFGEHGHRFFDLKRTGKLSELAFKPGFSPNDALWPIPQDELLSNPALAPQNPGY